MPYLGSSFKYRSLPAVSAINTIYVIRDKTKVCIEPGKKNMFIPETIPMIRLMVK